MYHSISDESSEAFRPFTVGPALFAAHIQHLVANGYQPVTASELAEMRATGRTPPDRTVAITFDDAFRDFVTVAHPVLQEAGFRSTLYVPTGFVGGSSRWLVAEGEQRRRLLSWGELSQLTSAGVECGAHSHSHPQLDLLDRRTAAHEIALSRSLLEDHLQLPVSSFAYPFGYSRRAVRELVSALGFSSAYGVADLMSGAGDDPFAVPRLTVTADTSVADLERLLSRSSGTVDEVRSRARSVASRALRTVRLKKSENAPGHAPGAPAAP